MHVLCACDVHVLCACLLYKVLSHLRIIVIKLKIMIEDFSVNFFYFSLLRKSFTMKY